MDVVEESAVVGPVAWPIADQIRVKSKVAERRDSTLHSPLLSVVELIRIFVCFSCKEI